MRRRGVVASAAAGRETALNNGSKSSGVFDVPFRNPADRTKEKGGDEEEEEDVSSDDFDDLDFDEDFDDDELTSLHSDLATSLSLSMSASQFMTDLPKAPAQATVVVGAAESAALASRARAAVKDGRPGDAVTLLSDAIRDVLGGGVAPPHARVFAARAEAFLAQGNAARALTDANYALALDAKAVPGHLIKARALLQLGQSGAAAASCRSVLAIDPKCAPARRLLMEACEQVASTEERNSTLANSLIIVKDFGN